MHFRRLSASPTEMIFTTVQDPFCNTIKQICAVNSKHRFLPQGVNLAVETQGQFTVYALLGDRLLTHPKQWCPSRSPEEAKTGSMLDKSLYLFSTRFPFAHLTTIWPFIGAQKRTYSRASFGLKSSPNF